MKQKESINQSIKTHLLSGVCHERSQANRRL